MTTQGPSPLPPTTIQSTTSIPQSTTSIPQSTANDFLSAYLDRAATDPALQPNASISEHGPISRTTASAPNLILHNLKRVQAGLAGEVLGRDLTLAKMNAEDESAGAGAGAGAGAAVSGGGDDGNAAEGEGEGGWDDAKQWERGQGDELAGQMDVDDAEGGGIDKEERKRKKKERRLAEKKSKGKGAEA